MINIIESQVLLRVRYARKTVSYQALHPPLCGTNLLANSTTRGKLTVSHASAFWILLSEIISFEFALDLVLRWVVYTVMFWKIFSLRSKNCILMGASSVTSWHLPPPGKADLEPRSIFLNIVKWFNYRKAMLETKSSLSLVYRYLEEVEIEWYDLRVFLPYYITIADVRTLKISLPRWGKVDREARRMRRLIRYRFSRSENLPVC